MTPSLGKRKKEKEKNLTPWRNICGWQEVSWPNCATLNQYQFLLVNKALQFPLLNPSRSPLKAHWVSILLNASKHNRPLGHWSLQLSFKEDYWKDRDSTLKYFMICSSIWNTFYHIKQLFQILYWSKCLLSTE